MAGIRGGHYYMTTLLKDMRDNIEQLQEDEKHRWATKCAAANDTAFENADESERPKLLEEAWNGLRLQAWAHFSSPTPCVLLKRP